jgi:hypothetical protein
MPKIPIDYSQTSIYKLCCNDLKIKDIYVGHTTNFTQRKNAHKYKCTNQRSKGYHIYVYDYIRKNGGWNNWSMVEIERVSCIDRNDAEKRERIFIETLGATLNQLIPTRTIKEWGIDNYDHKKEVSKVWYQQNIDRLREAHKKYYEKNREREIFKTQLRCIRHKLKDFYVKYHNMCRVCI